MASLTTDEEMLLAILDSDSDSNVVEFILVSPTTKADRKEAIKRHLSPEIAPETAFLGP